jgi:hypothetical protein
MKRLGLTLLAAAALAVASGFLLGGCQTPPSRIAYNSLATTGTTVSTAYQGYLELVLRGQVATNDVPAITAKYREFKASFDAACQLAAYSTNFTETPVEVLAKAGAVTAAINQARLK